MMAKWKVWLTAIGAALVAGVAFFLRGKRVGDIDARVDAALGKGKADAAKVRKQAADGDDAGVQKALAEAAEKAKRMTGLVVLLMTATGVAWSDVPRGTSPDCATRPSWCQPGYVCVPTPCAAESAVQLILLTSEVEAFKVKAKRSHFRMLGATCGPAASVFVDSGDTTWAGTLSCAVGLTFMP